MKKIKFAVLFFIIAQTGILYSQTTPEQIFSKGLEAFYGANFQEGIKYFSEYIISAPQISEVTITGDYVISQ